MTAEGQAVLVAQGKVKMPSVGWKGGWRGARKQALTKRMLSQHEHWWKQVKSTPK